MKRGWAEMRALPAGPTVVDMLASAAFLVGLSLWLAGRDQRWTYSMPFERADHGFYRAAQHGLAAELCWPMRDDGRLMTLPAAELVPQLLPCAHEGLVEAGVAAAEADHLLGVIAGRAAAGQTGAVPPTRPGSSGPNGPRRRPGASRPIRSLVGPDARRRANASQG